MSKSQNLKLDSLVELLDQYSDVYPRSPTGARGWVRARREMPKCDPEVYIDWDKTHWRYQGERDGWTFEHHFKLVEAGGGDEPSMERILDEAHQRIEEERCSDCGSLHPPQEEYVNTLMEGHEATLGAEAFAIVAIHRHEETGLTAFEPRIYSDALSEVARSLLHAQLVHVATQLFEHHILSGIEEVE